MTLELSGQAALTDPDQLARLPTRHGVFAIEDQAGRTVLLSTTANIRKSVNTKLTAVGRSARLDIRPIAQRIIALTVGSSFEADWAHLQWSRRLFPQTYAGLLDRWQPWFIQGHASAQHPQFIKTLHPSIDSPGIAFGPFPNKHAAGKYIELLQDVFDLCRHHHLLIQAPNAAACAYKEMGRCPAPCDGTVSLAAYRQQFSRAIEFACTPFADWKISMERKMQDASRELDFEQAAKCREIMERARAAGRAEFAMIDRLQHFKFIAVMPSDRKGWGRVFLINGGWIAPLLDFPTDSPASSFALLSDEICTRMAECPMCLSPQAVEAIGMVCWHLFRRRKTMRGTFIRASQPIEPSWLAQVAKRLRQERSTEEQAPERNLGDF